MSEHGFDPFEPEETIGKIWHAWASTLGTSANASGAEGVRLEDVEGRLGVFFRGLGGGHGVEIRPATLQAQHHRLSLKRALGTWRERSERASFDGEALRLPAHIAVFKQRELNEALYFWLAAVAAHAPDAVTRYTGLGADLDALRNAIGMTRRTLASCPGLKGLYGTLTGACLKGRQTARLPAHEQAVEAVIRHLLGGEAPTGRLARHYLELVRSPDEDLAGLAQPRAYRPFLQVPIWPDIRPLVRREEVDRLADAEEEGSGAGEAEGRKRARRSESDLAERRDSLVLHRFEAIFSWVESLNMNRRIEDDEEDTARRAADDQDELALGQVSKKTATRLKFHLDLSPQDAERERLSGVHVYPEWDHRAGCYLQSHVRVLASRADGVEEGETLLDDPAVRRRIRAVRRQFEALRPRRVILPRQLDGEELDLEAAISSRVELLATGEGHNRVYRAARTQERDLAVFVLMDTSRSTESSIGGRMVIDVEKEALTALAWGLDACGDDFSIQTFSSLKRDRVYVLESKGFDEKMGQGVERRIAGLSPSFYTRLGAAVRHASAGLAMRPSGRQLLLVITDGKPNDLDHYEGRHGIEDSRMAVREARRRGQAVYGVVVEGRGQSWFPRIFGAAGYSLVPDAEKLIGALPHIYRQITGAA